MASYLPPTEDLPIFDSEVFDIANSTALTYAEAKKLFLTYPTAQGTQTISSLIAGEIDYSAPLAGSFFDIGTNQVSGGTIRLGPTGTSGVSVHAGNIDCTNNTINNATDASLNNLALGNSQTSGVLNIGTGVRVSTGNGGAINIGGGANSDAPINIGPISTVAGTSVTNINTSTSATGVINIGSSTATTNIKGPLAITGSTSVTSGSNITLASGNVTCTLGQLIAPTLRNGANTASIGNTGIVTGVSVNTPTLTTATAVGLSIGTSTASSIGIGYGSIVTTLNGIVKTATSSFVRGRLTFRDQDLITLPYTVSSANVDSDFYINVFGGLPATGGITIANDFAAGQNITIKISGGYPVTITFTTLTLWLNEGNSTVSSYILNAGETLSFVQGNNAWFQTNTTNNLNLRGKLTAATGITSNAFSVPTTLSNINYNTVAGAGGSVQTITLPSSGVYMYTFGANYDNMGVTTTTCVVGASQGVGGCRLFNTSTNPSYAVTYASTGGLTFTITTNSIPNNFNSFSVSYVKLG
jgi:hypothetical protein